MQDQSNPLCIFQGYGSGVGLPNGSLGTLPKIKVWNSKSQDFGLHFPEHNYHHHLSCHHQCVFAFLFGCGNLVPQPRIEPGLPAVEVQTPNHWTSVELPSISVFIFIF